MSKLRYEPTFFVTSLLFTSFLHTKNRPKKYCQIFPSYYHCSELNFKNVQSLRPTRRVALLLLHSILQKYAICIYDICFDLFCIMVMGELIHRYSFYELVVVVFFFSYVQNRGWCRQTKERRYRSAYCIVSMGELLLTSFLELVVLHN